MSLLIIVKSARSSLERLNSVRVCAGRSVKQHVALQMLLAGKSNAEIAERFAVTENGSKVYVRAIYKKFGVHTRSQAVVAVYDEFEAISSKWYAAISKGIPKEWSAEWLDGPVEDDPFRTLYQARQGEAEDEG